MKKIKSINCYSFYKVIIVAVFSAIVLSCGKEESPNPMPDPTPEPGPSPEFYQSIDAGFNHSFGIAPNDELWGWGSNSVGQIGDSNQVFNRGPILIDSGYVSISAGGEVSTSTHGGIFGVPIT